MSPAPIDIDLQTPLRLRTCLRFPIQNAAARRELLIGAAWLLVPGVGWLLNMGHRIAITHRMMQGEPAWPAWRDHRALLRHGALTFLGMVYYHAPGALLGWLAWRGESAVLGSVASLLLVGATVAVPGFMSHYCRELDAREIFDPLRALRRCVQGGAAYWHAWSIALCALVLSFAGLALAGVGFLLSSVWFWQVAGFAFASVMTRRFELDRAAGTRP
jgi:hypothetical protein